MSRRPEPRSALLILDMVSEFRFPNAGPVLRGARQVAPGITAHQCVLFTAMDAHVREYELIVPRDCTVH
jgi:nicotinamidase-related amidase